MQRGGAEMYYVAAKATRFTTKAIFRSPSLHRSRVEFCITNASLEYKTPSSNAPAFEPMTIADSCVYLKEYLKQQPNSQYARKKHVNFRRTKKSFLSGLGLIDDFSSPGSWQKAMDLLDKKYPGTSNRLKLCLAHYGGQGFFDGTYGRGTPYEWVTRITDLIKPTNQVFTDLSCFAYSCGFDSTEGISGGDINKCPTLNRVSNYYSKMYQYFIIPDKVKALTAADRVTLNKELLGLVKGNRKYAPIVQTADRLAGLLWQNGILRHRIMYGTDWPMLETTVTSIPKYNATMFIILQLVTESLKGAWDVWHQFAVINPLRFLGLLKDPKDVADYYELDTGKFAKFKKNIENYLGVIDKDTEERNKFDKLFKLSKKDCLTATTTAWNTILDMGKTKIPAAHKMRNKDGKLIILEGF